ncbi:MAG TPA: DUF2884 family protein [Gammaproteobacteria bacterium]|nr:DUF2884 family protein [Gammaproteobacteria bacterium]
MNKYLIVFSSAVFATVFAANAAMASGTTIHASEDGNNRVTVINSHDIHIKNGNVIISSDHGNEATITTDGGLVINGKSVPVSDQDRIKLMQYNSTVKDIENRGIKLGMDATGFALDVVADVIGDLLSGESEEEIDKHANARAHRFKQKALPICEDVHTLKQIQDTLSADIPSFKPFAVIEGRDADDCEHDIKTND